MIIQCKNGDKIQFTDAYFNHFKKGDHIIFQGVLDMRLFQPHETVETVCRAVLMEDPYEESQVDEDDCIFFKVRPLALDEYKAQIKRTVHAFEMDELFIDVINETIFYECLLRNGYVKKLN
jgi:hypothetical protein